MAREIVETRIWLSRDLRSAEFLRGRFRGFAYDLHTHETACFALLTQGSIRIRMPHREFTARKGDLYTIDGGEPHAGWPVDGGGWSLRTLYVDLSALGARMREELKQGTFAFASPVIRDPVLEGLFAALHGCSEQGGSTLAFDEALQRFLHRLVRLHARSAAAPKALGQEDRAVRQARAFLDERLDVRVSLEDIAQAVGLPPFRILRAFQRSMGLSPHAYQRQARIQHAMRLLKSGDPIGRVAAATGFSDQAHLTRSLRRSLGVTPGAYRTAMLQATP